MQKCVKPAFFLYTLMIRFLLHFNDKYIHLVKIRNGPVNQQLMNVMNKTFIAKDHES